MSLYTVTVTSDGRNARRRKGEYQCKSTFESFGSACAYVNGELYRMLTGDINYVTVYAGPPEMGRVAKRWSRGDLDG